MNLTVGFYWVKPPLCKWEVAYFDGGVWGRHGEEWYEETTFFEQIGSFVEPPYQPVRDELSIYPKR